MFSSYISIIVSLFILEVLLSIDNALVNATLAEALPEHKRIKAIRIGIVLGAVFRLVALFFCCTYYSECMAQGAWRIVSYLFGNGSSWKDC
jgi:predicted tellurium resistance membrane protein TerC